MIFAASYNLTDEARYVELTTIEPTIPVPETSTSTTSSEPVHNHSYNWSVIQQGSAERDQIELQRCDCGATGETRVISAYQIFTTATMNEIKNATPGSTVIVSSNLFYSFSNAFMQEVANRRDITVCFDYIYNGYHYAVTITPEMEVNLAERYYGPEWLFANYGGTKEAISQ